MAFFAMMLKSMCACVSDWCTTLSDHPHPTATARPQRADNTALHRIIWKENVKPNEACCTYSSLNNLFYGTNREIAKKIFHRRLHSLWCSRFFSRFYSSF